MKRMINKVASVGGWISIPLNAMLAKAIVRKTDEAGVQVRVYATGKIAKRIDAGFMIDFEKNTISEISPIRVSLCNPIKKPLYWSVPGHEDVLLQDTVHDVVAKYDEDLHTYYISFTLTDNTLQQLGLTQEAFMSGSLIFNGQVCKSKTQYIGWNLE